ncbi:hypothetical protein [Natrialba chahannaoensis]|uniref:hypothetical protein n=1 Tax=Natrialba chahannaoensis TaxID=68911 RepID=UPI000AFC4667|nr:hypothetical protein [Natrialba chahannaoensis]
MSRLGCDLTVVTPSFESGLESVPPIHDYVSGSGLESPDDSVRDGNQRLIRRDGPVD